MVDWVPIERLPAKRERYLLLTTWNAYRTERLAWPVKWQKNKKGWYFVTPDGYIFWPDDECVIAWAEFPEPYTD